VKKQKLAESFSRKFLWRQKIKSRLNDCHAIRLQDKEQLCAQWQKFRTSGLYSNEWSYGKGWIFIASEERQEQQHYIYLLLCYYC